MSAFVDLLSQYIDNLQIEGDFATGQIDTDEKYNEFRQALKNFGYSFTIRSSRKETYSGEGKYVSHLCFDIFILVNNEKFNIFHRKKFQEQD